MRYLLFGILLFHGLIHIAGFSNAFGYIEIGAADRIPKQTGWLWLIAALFFILLSFICLANNRYWWVYGIVAVLLSQALIIYSWKIAGYGTLVNIIILIYILSAYGRQRFTAMTSKERNSIMNQLVLPGKIINASDLVALPEPVQHWLRKSGVLGREAQSFAELEQKGQMRLKPGGRWIFFTARQWFRTDKPAFLWVVRVRMGPLLYLDGRDLFFNGKGSMLIRGLSFINIENTGNDKKTDAATMIRFLAETCWLPSAAVNKYILWEAMDERCAKATMSNGSDSVSGVFNFNEEGDVLSFTAQRYYGSGPGASLQTWIIDHEEWKSFGSIRIPVKSRITWKLPGETFTWAKIEVVSIKYNNNLSL